MCMSLEALGCSPAKIKQFNRKGISCAEDLIRFFPRRYMDYSKDTGILPENEISCLTAKCIKVSKTSGKVSTLRAVCLLEDGRYITCVWFNQAFMLAKVSSLLQRQVFIAGKVKYDPAYRSYSILSPQMFEASEDRVDVVPVYSKINGMSDEYFGSKMAEAFSFPEIVVDPLPSGTGEALGYLPEGTALLNTHFPFTVEDAEKSHERVVFDELTAFAAATYWKEKSSAEGSPYQVKTLALMNRMRDSLPYELTSDQKKVVDDILQLQKNGRRINALIQGDVGCGKTITAALIMAAFAGSGYQVCLMAPTKVLAGQHYEDLKALFTPLGIDVVYLYSGMKVREKKAALKKISEGAQVIVGTHSVIGKDVQYKNLALVVCDEEHKFGNQQKLLLAQKGSLGCHSISMSATPIPKSLASVIYGLGCSVFSIKTLPSGRKPVITGIAKSREKIYNFLVSQIGKGRQAFVIAPMIDENEELDIASVEQLSREYSEYMAPYDISVATLTGRDDKKKAEQIISDFKSGATDILVSTSIVEVGVNVPNASVIVISAAERFGLSQLHQLRGRVGRSSHQSYCVLETDDTSEKAQKRLDVLCRNNDGFKIAEEDLALRGAGDLVGGGDRQSGTNRFLSLMLEYPKIYKDAQKVARDIIYNGMPCPLLDDILSGDLDIAESQTDE